MTTAPVAGHAHMTGLATARGTTPAAAARVARMAFSALARWLRVRRTTSELLRLDDRMLSDIGLSRSMLLSASLDAERAKDRGYGVF